MAVKAQYWALYAELGTECSTPIAVFRHPAETEGEVLNWLKTQGIVIQAKDRDERLHGL